MQNILHGGKADRRALSSFPRRKVEEGMKVEREHTSNRAIAKEIASDHLVEDQNYYTKLKKMEKSSSVDAFFDEMKKISANLSSKGALIGGAVGAGVGALRALSHEPGERAWDERAHLTPEEKKKARKKRFVRGLASTTALGAAGAGLGATHKKLLGTMAGTIRKNVQPEIDKAVEQAAGKVSDRVKASLVPKWVQRIQNILSRKKR